MNAWFQVGGGIRVSERSPQGLTFFLCFPMHLNVVQAQNLLTLFKCSDVVRMCLFLFKTCFRWFRGAHDACGFVCVCDAESLFFLRSDSPLWEWPHSHINSTGSYGRLTWANMRSAIVDAPALLRFAVNGPVCRGHIEHVHKLRLLFVFVHDPVWMLRTVCFCSHILSNVF